MNTQLEQLQLNVRKANGLLSLNDLWAIAGNPKNKSVKDWIRLPGTKAFIDAAVKFLKVEKSHLLEIKQGKGGGTWAHPQIALEYAQYISADFAVRVNHAFLERVEEEKNPELAVQRGNARAAKTWTRQGHDDRWIDQRIMSISARKAFTGVLKTHGVEREGYRNCTNAVYSGIFGGTSNVVRQKLDLGRTDSIRDNMSLLQLSATQLVEVMAMEDIEQNNLRGNANCEQACTKASKIVASAIVQSRRK